MIRRPFLPAKLEQDILCYFSTRSSKIVWHAEKFLHNILPNLRWGHRVYRVPESPGRSSEIAPPPRPPQASMSLPPRIQVGGGGYTRSLVEGGGGGANSYEGTDTMVLCIVYTGTNPFSLNGDIENYYIFQY
jgi:hypothetical protein